MHPPAIATVTASCRNKSPQTTPNTGMRNITTMLRGKQGEMWLDDHLVQKDGVWQPVPELGIGPKDIDVLNDGWAAIPEAQRPPYWRKKLAAEAELRR